MERFGSRHHRTENRLVDGREAAVAHFEERLASGHFDDAAGFFKRAVEAHDWEFGQPTAGCRNPAEIEAMCRFMRLFDEVLREQTRRDRGIWGGQPVDPIFTGVEAADPERHAFERTSASGTMPCEEPHPPAPRPASPAPEPSSEDGRRLSRVVDLADSFWIDRRDNRPETRVKKESLPRRKP